MSNLYNIQKDPIELERAIALKPHEFYNKYIRKEGQKVYSEQEYRELIKDREAIKDREGYKLYDGSLHFIYPKTPDESYAPDNI